MSFDPIKPPEMITNHTRFQEITAAILVISTSLKFVFSKKRLKIENEGKLNTIIYISLFLIVLFLTIYTTIINSTALL